MSSDVPVVAADLRGVNRLTIAGIAGIVDVVEAIHHSIPGVPDLLGAPKRDRTTGITRLVYRGVRGVVGVVGQGLDLLLAQFEPLLGERSDWPGRAALRSALNGVLGDYLQSSGNPLAIPMQMRRRGVALPEGHAELAAAIPRAGGKLLVLVHGLCMNDLQWRRRGHDHGASLARDLGYTPVYLHYNSGRHVSVNGRELAQQLEGLVKRWPVPLTELSILGHSMGGLVAHSACHYAAQSRHQWLRHLDRLVFIGTPHQGAPLERGGHWIDLLLGASPYSAPLARLGKIRSAGITDLRYGNLVDEDWKRHGRFERRGDRRKVVLLPKGVACYAIAATTGRKAGDFSDRLIGDGIVPVASALGHHSDPRRELPFDASRQWLALATNHLDLLSKRQVYAQIRRWLADPA